MLLKVQVGLPVKHCRFPGEVFAGLSRTLLQGNGSKLWKRFPIPAAIKINQRNQNSETTQTRKWPRAMNELMTTALTWHETEVGKTCGQASQQPCRWCVAEAGVFTHKGAPSKQVRFCEMRVVVRATFADCFLASPP